MQFIHFYGDDIEMFYIYTAQKKHTGKDSNSIELDFKPDIMNRKMSYARPTITIKQNHLQNKRKSNIQKDFKTTVKRDDKISWL